MQWKTQNLINYFASLPLVNNNKHKFWMSTQLSLTLFVLMLQLTNK